MKYRIDGLDLGPSEDNPRLSYTLSTEGETVEEMLLNAVVFEDFEGAEGRSYQLGDVPGFLERRIAHAIVTEMMRKGAA